MLMLIYNEILHILYLKISFHIDGHCQILISVYEHMIIIKHIHRLEGILKIMLNHDICLLACHYTAD